MKRKLTAFLLTLAMVLTTLPVAAFAAARSYSDYIDVEGHWAESSINRWSQCGIVNGVGGNRFNPNGYMTRAEAAAVFARLLDLQKTEDVSRFADVKIGGWYREYVAKNVAYKLMNGTSSTTMEPKGNITREQFFTIFARGMGVFPDNVCERPFEDTRSVSSWAKGSVYALINLGYVNGVTDTLIAPQMLITRAMVMKLLDNAVSNYITKDGSYTVSGHGIVIALADNVSLSGNFNGWIVAAADNGILDLENINGKPGIFVLKDNVEIFDAPVGTTVTTSTVAQGTVANGDPVPPGTTIVIQEKQEQDKDSGSKKSYTRYTVQASVKSFGRQLDLARTYKVKKTSSEPSLSDAALDLISGDNALAIQNTLDQAMGKLLNRNWASDNKSVSISAGGEITAMENGAPVNISAALEKINTRYLARMSELRAAAGIPDSAAWKSYVEAFAPKSAFRVSGTSVALYTAEEYFDILEKAVNAAAALHDSLGSGFNYANAIQGVSVWADGYGIKLGDYTVNGYTLTEGDSVAALSNTGIADVLRRTSGALSSVTAGKNPCVLFKAESDALTSGSYILNLIEGRTGRDLSEYAGLESVLDALASEIGTAAITVTVTRN